jgi:trypsin-like peptidase
MWEDTNMLDIQKLKELSVDELRQELRAREAKAGKAILAVPLEPHENLRQFDDATIIKVLKEQQELIYGTDDRVDVFQLPPGPNLDDVDSVVALFLSEDVIDNGNGTSTLRTKNYGAEFNLCPGERFRDQPTGAFCSGFLVAPDVIATAGHCVGPGGAVTASIRFVFGFRMRNATTAETVIQNGEIYRAVKIIGRQNVADGPDWALVRIDRPVTNHRVARIRRAGKIGNAQAVHGIGHPKGLPTKFAGGAVVRDNQPEAFFAANLDTYMGNSGSPVFNSDTHEVEGILVRGDIDFVQQGNCQVSLVCPTTGCRGEDCTRISQIIDGRVSYRQPDGLILSTGNLYFTSHDASTASVWRTAQGSSPGQEFLLYSEQGARFGDIVFAQVDGIWWGYFFATKAGVVTIKRVPLTGGAATDMKTIENVDVANSHRNLATDGVNLYWQDVNSVRKMPIRGGDGAVLDATSPNTPTAGIALRNGTVIYASVADIRYVPTGGAVTAPWVRTIATASSRVTALHAVSNGVYWGEQSGAIRLKVGNATTTLPSTEGLVPTSISTNGFTAGAAQAWTQCGSGQCSLHFDFPVWRGKQAISANALGVTVTSSGNVFWGDANGVHRRVF